jgi:hypothetical protein
MSYKKNDGHQNFQTIHCPNSCSVKALDQRYVIKNQLCINCPLFQILSGDNQYILKIFYWIGGKGYFPYIASNDIIKDICQEVSLALYIHYKSGRLQSIHYIKAFIRKIVYNKASNENRYNSKRVSIETLYP